MPTKNQILFTEIFAIILGCINDAIMGETKGICFGILIAWGISTMMYIIFLMQQKDNREEWFYGRRFFYYW